MSSSGDLNLAALDPSGALEALTTLISFLEAKSALGATPGHHLRVRALSLAIAAQLELSPDDRRRLEVAALFHDLGLTAVPEALLTRPRRLTSGEYDLVKAHPAGSVEILRSVVKDEGVLEAIRHHHEAFGGGGYPDGRAGEQIPLLARILAVPEIFDSMVHDRPWRRSMSLRQARALVAANSGSLFDPRVVEAFLAIDEEALAACLRTPAPPAVTDPAATESGPDASAVLDPGI